MSGRHEGNPFTDYTIQGTFKGKEETKTVDGFYDGDGIYRVRFMPSFEGDYTFEIKGSFSDEVYTGAFHVTPATEGNHDRSVYPTPIIWHMKMETLLFHRNNLLCVGTSERGASETDTGDTGRQCIQQDSFLCIPETLRL